MTNKEKYLAFILTGSESEDKRDVFLLYLKSASIVSTVDVVGFAWSTD